MEKKMETTIVLYWSYKGVMEKEMETTYLLTSQFNRVITETDGNMLRREQKHDHQHTGLPNDTRQR